MRPAKLYFYWLNEIKIILVAFHRNFRLGNVIAKIAGNMLLMRTLTKNPVKRNLIHLAKTCNILTVLTKHGLSYQDLDRTKILGTS